MIKTERQTNSLKPYTGVCRFFLSVKFANSQLTSLAGGSRKTQTFKILRTVLYRSFSDQKSWSRGCQRSSVGGACTCGSGKLNKTCSLAEHIENRAIEFRASRESEYLMYLQILVLYLEKLSFWDMVTKYIENTYRFLAQQNIYFLLS